MLISGLFDGLKTSDMKPKTPFLVFPLPRDRVPPSVGVGRGELLAEGLKSVDGPDGKDSLRSE